MNFQKIDMAAEWLEQSFWFGDTGWRTPCPYYTDEFLCRWQINKKLNARNAILPFRMWVITMALLLIIKIKRKNNGGLITPSWGISEVLKRTEKAFRILMPSPQLMQTLPLTWKWKCLSSGKLLQKKLRTSFLLSVTTSLGHMKLEMMNFITHNYWNLLSLITLQCSWTKTGETINILQSFLL